MSPSIVLAESPSFMALRCTLRLLIETSWFTYTPFAGLLFIPLAIALVAIVKIFATVIDLSCVVLAAWMCWRQLGYREGARLTETNTPPAWTWPLIAIPVGFAGMVVAAVAHRRGHELRGATLGHDGHRGLTIFLGASLGVICSPPYVHCPPCAVREIQSSIAHTVRDLSIGL